MSADPVDLTGLVPYLRRRWDAPELDIAGAPTPLAGGFANPVFSVTVSGAPWGDGDLVVRIDSMGPGSRRFEREHAAHGFAHAAGYPTPEPLLLELDDAVVGAPFVVMRRAPGRTLLDQLLPPSRRTFRAMDLVADCLARLHEVPVDGFPRRADRAEEYRDDVRGSVDRFPELAPFSAWLDRHAPPPATLALCHLDLHPANVLVTAAPPALLATPTVIDWENAGLGDPMFDLADSLVVLTRAPLEDLPSFVQPPLFAARRLLGRRLVAAYASHRWVDRDRLAYFQVLSATRRLRNALLDRPTEPGAAPTGFTSPAFIAGISRFVERRTR